MLAAMTAPCSVKAVAGLRRPPCRELDIAICDIKMACSSAVGWKAKSAGKRAVALDGLVQTMCGHAIESGQVGVEKHALPTDQPNVLRNVDSRGCRLSIRADHVDSLPSMSGARHSRKCRFSRNMGARIMNLRQAHVATGREDLGCSTRSLRRSGD